LTVRGLSHKRCRGCTWVVTQVLSWRSYSSLPYTTTNTTFLHNKTLVITPLVSVCDNPVCLHTQLNMHTLTTLCILTHSGMVVCPKRISIHNPPKSRFPGWTKRLEKRRVASSLTRHFLAISRVSPEIFNLKTMFCWGGNLCTDDATASSVQLARDW
jgi:hypothetical protein